MKIIAIGFLIILTACSRSSITNAMELHVHSFGARDDLNPELSGKAQPPTNIPISENTDVRIIDFPLTYAIECNFAKNNCKHAVVKTRLELRVHAYSDQELSIEGVLHSETGRSLSVTGEISTTTRSVADSVPLISEDSQHQRFEKTLHFGEKLELSGIAGTHVIVEFN